MSYQHCNRECSITRGLELDIDGGEGQLKSPHTLNSLFHGFPIIRRVVFLQRKLEYRN